MTIRYSRLFLKNYKKRIKTHPPLRNRFRQRVLLFERDSRHPLLRDHALKGKKQDFRAFSITGDIRVIYVEEEKGIVRFIDVGTHAQVYGM